MKRLANALGPALALALLTQTAHADLGSWLEAPRVSPHAKVIALSTAAGVVGAAVMKDAWYLTAAPVFYAGVLALDHTVRRLGNALLHERQPRWNERQRRLRSRVSARTRQRR